jgi:hypothetical protein
MTVVANPVVPMRGIWQTIRSYILWSYERGTVQYDVMVTLILLFVFFSPKLVSFNDKPVDRSFQRAGVLVTPDGRGGLIYQVEASAVTNRNGGDLRRELLQIIEPISGEVTISRYEIVRDQAGQARSYKVFVER